jgi:hypothetical protein
MEGEGRVRDIAHQAGRSFSSGADHWHAVMIGTAPRFFRVVVQ